MDDQQSTFAVDDRFLGDWVGFGLAELEAYLAKQARFAAFCDRLELDEAAQSLP
jgi:hypothetical protein